MDWLLLGFGVSLMMVGILLAYNFHYKPFPMIAAIALASTGAGFIFNAFVFLSGLGTIFVWIGVIAFGCLCLYNIPKAFRFAGFCVTVHPNKSVASIVAAFATLGGFLAYAGSSNPARACFILAGGFLLLLAFQKLGLLARN